MYTGFEIACKLIVSDSSNIYLVKSFQNDSHFFFIMVELCFQSIEGGYRQTYPGYGGVKG